MSGLILSRVRDYAMYLALKSSGQGIGEKVQIFPSSRSCTVQLNSCTLNGKEMVKKYFLHYEEIEVQVGKSFLSIAVEKIRKLTRFKGIESLPQTYHHVVTSNMGQCTLHNSCVSCKSKFEFKSRLHIP